MAFNPWGFLLAEQHDCPVVLFSPTGTFHSHSQLIGNTFNPSYQPVVTNDLADPTSFRDRLKNFASYWVMDFVVRIFADSVITGSIRSTLDYSGPTMFEIARQRLAIILSNSHYLVHSPQPQLPNLIDVGGVHLKKHASPLPADIQQFLDRATRGAVYVSFGSAIRTSRITAEKRQMFLDAFKELGLPVILKWDTELEEMPENVMVSCGQGRWGTINNGWDNKSIVS
jgi:glucuronosyltransferase